MFIKAIHEGLAEFYRIQDIIQLLEEELSFAQTGAVIGSLTAEEKAEIYGKQITALKAHQEQLSLRPEPIVAATPAVTLELPNTNTPVFPLTPGAAPPVPPMVNAEAPAPLAPPAPNATLPECDANGEVWDAVKHSKSKSKTKAGLWMPKRGYKKPTDDPATDAFDGLVKQFSKLLGLGRITGAGFAELCASLGVESIVSIKDNPEMIAKVTQRLTEAYPNEA